LTDVADIGGAERRLIDLTTYLDRTRFELIFCVLAQDGPLLEELRQRGFAAHALGVRTARDYPSAFVAFYRLIRRWRPSIVHGQIRHASFMAALAARLTRVPVVVASRTYTARIGSHVFLDRWTSRMVDVTIAVSHASAGVVRREERMADDRVRVIPNGVDIREFSAPPAVAIHDTARKLGVDGWRVVGTIGHLHPIKGHSTMIEAARAILNKVPDTKFLIVGGGWLHEELAALAAARGVAEHVIFTGARTDVPALLALMDVFVLPSLNEGMSHALLEAMVLGKPVVATAVGGNCEVVEPGTTGILVPPRDAAALSAAVVQLLTDPAAAARLGRAAADAARTRFSARRMAEAYFSVYETLLSRRGMVDS
jgi:glycosyltransferase involved in cell wall biosynthesis